MKLFLLCSLSQHFMNFLIILLLNVVTPSLGVCELYDDVHEIVCIVKGFINIIATEELLTHKINSPDRK